MQVITLNPQELDRHAERLAKAVEESGDTVYDAIVAVWRGGAYVCDAFLRHFPEQRYGERYDIRLQRPGTKQKEGLMRQLLRRLPYPLLNVMRIAESWAFGLHRRIKGEGKTPHVDIPDGMANILTKNPKPNILLIDDAIDSGDTLRAIVETLKKMSPESKIDIAAITETTERPRIRANHILYRNRTLIRFPWSNDYKNH